MFSPIIAKLLITNTKEKSVKQLEKTGVITFK